MSSNTQTRTLGQAPSMAGANAAALKLYNVYHGRKEKPLFSDMLFAEIVSDNLEGEIFNYSSSWCSSTPIPIFFDENLQPPFWKGTKTAQFDSTTLSKYIGKVISQQSRRKFPQHPDFVDLCAEEVPQWWTKLRPLFEMQCIRFHFLPPWERLYVRSNSYALATIPEERK
jgi:hypothetical protein